MDSFQIVPAGVLAVSVSSSPLSCSPRYGSFGMKASFYSGYLIETIFSVSNELRTRFSTRELEFETMKNREIFIYRTGSARFSWGRLSRAAVNRWVNDFYSFISRTFFISIRIYRKHNNNNDNNNKNLRRRRRLLSSSSGTSASAVASSDSKRWDFRISFDSGLSDGVEPFFWIFSMLRKSHKKENLTFQSPKTRRPRRRFRWRSSGGDDFCEDSCYCCRHYFYNCDKIFMK